MKSLWWTLIQHDWYPYKRLGLREVPREDHVKTQKTGIYKLQRQVLTIISPNIHIKGSLILSLLLNCCLCTFDGSFHEGKEFVLYLASGA